MPVPPETSHGEIDDLPGAFHAVVLGKYQLRWPPTAVVHSVRPILTHLVDLCRHAVQDQRHLGYAVLQHRVVRERTPTPGTD
jgi:hypothetical protein